MFEDVCKGKENGPKKTFNTQLSLPTTWILFCSVLKTKTSLLEIKQNIYNAIINMYCLERNIKGTGNIKRGGHLASIVIISAGCFSMALGTSLSTNYSNFKN